MCRILAILTCCLFITLPTRGDDLIFPNGTPASVPGGIMVIRKNGETTWSLGGVLLPRYVKVKTNTPEGPVVAKFRFPSVFHTPETPPLPTATPGLLLVQIPDPYGLIFVDSELVRTKGTSRQFESPPLALGKAYPLNVRAAYAIGDKLLIEEKQVLLRAGETIPIDFDGKRALAVPLKRGNDHLSRAPPAE